MVTLLCLRPLLRLSCLRYEALSVACIHFESSPLACVVSYTRHHPGSSSQHDVQSTSKHYQQTKDEHNKQKQASKDMAGGGYTRAYQVQKHNEELARKKEETAKKLKEFAKNQEKKNNKW